METYADISGDSGIAGYEILPEGIIVRFKDGDTYLYTHASTGKHHIEQMKTLARRGKGLATYINKYVREKYERRVG